MRQKQRESPIQQAKPIEQCAEDIIASIEEDVRKTYPVHADKILLEERNFLQKVFDFYQVIEKNPEPTTIIWYLDASLGYDEAAEDKGETFHYRPSAVPLITALKQINSHITHRVLCQRALPIEQTGSAALSQTPAWDSLGTFAELINRLTEEEETWLESIYAETEISLDRFDQGKLVYARRLKAQDPSLQIYFIDSCSLSHVRPNHALLIDRKGMARSWRAAIQGQQKEQHEAAPIIATVNWWKDQLRLYNTRKDTQIFAKGPWSEELLEAFGRHLFGAIKQELTTKSSLTLSVDRQADTLL
jgi:hypothetical protein